jgi:hypothetical protein
VLSNVLKGQLQLAYLAQTTLSELQHLSSLLNFKSVLNLGLKHLHLAIRLSQATDSILSTDLWLCSASITICATDDDCRLLRLLTGAECFVSASALHADQH